MTDTTPDIVEPIDERDEENAAEAAEEVESHGGGWQQIALAAAALLLIGAITFWAVGQLLSDDGAAQPDLSGRVVVTESTISIVSDTEAGFVDLRGLVPTYGTGANVVGVESDGADGFVVGLTLSQPDEPTDVGWIIHAPAGETPRIILEDHPGGVQGLLGVGGGVAVFEESVPEIVDDIARVGITKVDLDGESAPEEITVASPNRSSMGGTRVLVLEDFPCTELVVYDVATDERVVLEPFPEDPGCWQENWVPDLKISEDGSEAVYLRFFNEVMESAIAEIDDPGTIEIVPAVGIFSLLDVFDPRVEESLERTSFEATVDGSIVVDRTAR